MLDACVVAGWKQKAGPAVLVGVVSDGTHAGILMPACLMLSKEPEQPPAMASLRFRSRS